MTAPNIILAEHYAFHAPYFAKTPDLYASAISRNLREGSKITASAYIQSRRELEAVRRVIGQATDWHQRRPAAGLAPR
ncbi:MAG TPA: hypothetical protein VL882_00015 [Vicinamibacterales bacterium]|jgi:hypothetical protein|nr:hypothetical protein [Vicinamibacterales bacterium]